MKNNKLDKNIEKVRMNLYNVLAVLIVIIPEYFAELIYTIEMSPINFFKICQQSIW